VYSTEITVTGNLVGPPMKRRVGESSVVAFRIASTGRRFDRGSGGWVDGATLFMDVDCWGELGGNVIRSVAKGDPVVVHGHVFTEEWDSEGGRRQRNKIRAGAVGLNLSRGHCDFHRTLRQGPAEAPATSEAAADATADATAEAGVPGSPLPATGPVDVHLTSGDYTEEADALDPVDSEEPSRQASLV
jgi:single-strand DNA-binding protein